MSAAHSRLAAGILVSSLVHAASTRLLQSVPVASVPAAQSLPFEFELMMQAPDEAVIVPAREPPQPTRPRTARHATARRPAELGPPVAEPASLPLTEPAPPHSSEKAGENGAIDLSPLAAARTLVDVRAAPSSWSQEPQVSSSDGTNSVAALAEGIPGLSPAGHESFNARARGMANVALRPWSLLQPLPRGAYYYDGRAFDAVIREDGSVAYRNKDGLHMGVTQTQIVTKAATRAKGQGLNDVPTGKGHKNASKPFQQTGIAIGLALPDPERWLQWLAGSPRNQLEQREFLENTRALRERLMAQSSSAARARAEREMERELSRIWSDARLDLTERTRRTFALWDECADDEVGATMRAQIEAFVRSHCPERADRALSEPLLKELNATRRSRAPFAPY